MGDALDFMSKVQEFREVSALEKYTTVGDFYTHNMSVRVMKGWGGGYCTKVSIFSV